MTTANLVISGFGKETKNYVLRKWHDGYGVGDFLATILEGWALDDLNFSSRSLVETLTSEADENDSDFDFELVAEKEGDGSLETEFQGIFTDWTWHCVFANEKQALITGTNGSEVWVKRIG